MSVMIAFARRSHMSFLFIFVVVFLAGAAFRVGPQLMSASHAQASTSVASTPSYVVINNGDQSPVPKNAAARDVVGFYRTVINGDFDRAYGLSLENRWHAGPGGSPTVVGTQPRDLFVGALDDEIGSEGLPVGIVRLAVDWERPLRLGPAAVRSFPELLALRFLPRGTRVGSPYEAHISGRLVGNCAISGFARTDIAVKINGSWKVLLPGRPHPSDPHFEEWFLPHTHFHAHVSHA
jgi:hypothetical protein